jgi:hypothetical protein
MTKLLLAAVLLAGTAFASMPAQAAVVALNHLSGTGDNVIFDSVDINTNVARGSFNGQHTGFVDFSCLGGCLGFTGASNGNDIKIANTNNLRIQVFDAQGNPIGTTTDVFSLNGTGSVTATAFAVDENGNVESPFTFALGALDPHSPSNWTFAALNGEVITSIVLLDIGGNITDFEHYRIDAAAIPLVATPLPAPAILFLSGIVGIGMLKRYSARKRVGLDIATA